jgi:hypothetical protein
MVHSVQANPLSLKNPGDLLDCLTDL